MIHLKKKYILEVKADNELASVLNSAPVEETFNQQLETTSLGDHYALVYTDTGQIFQTFKYEENGVTYLIPEPDPIIMYFDNARFYVKHLQSQRETVFENLRMFSNNIGAVNGNFYSYFTMASTYALALFTSIEAFINKIIPSNFEYRREVQDKRTEVYTRDQIQRYVDFTEKLKYVIPQITGKNFVSENGHKYDIIKKLKTFRDEIAHTKTYQGPNNPNHYEDLFATSLKFDYENTLLVIKDFINYYKPGLIEECNCGRTEE